MDRYEEETRKQYQEYLIRDGKKNPNRMDNPRRRNFKTEAKDGQNLSGNIGDSSKDKKFGSQPDKEAGFIETNNRTPSKGKAPYCGKRRNYRKPDRD